MPNRGICVAVLSIALIITAVGASASPEQRSSVPLDLAAAQLIPLRADTPAWYTTEVNDGVLQAAEQGLAYDVEKAAAVPVAMSFLFIRPGAWMISPSLCTMNFVYGSLGDYSIGSAGHCNAAGSDVVVLVAPGLLAKIGKTSTSMNGGIGHDYSIVKVDSVWQPYVDANVAYVQGPQGGEYSNPLAYPTPVVVKHVGHGVGIGTSGTPRIGEAMYDTPDKKGFYCHCVVAPGDSGSPMLAVTAAYPMGQALGVVTHLVVVGPGLTLAAGTRVDSFIPDVVDGDLNPLP